MSRALTRRAVEAEQVVSTRLGTLTLRAWACYMQSCVRERYILYTAIRYGGAACGGREGSSGENHVLFWGKGAAALGGG